MMGFANLGRPEQEPLARPAFPVCNPEATAKRPKGKEAMDEVIIE